MATCVKIIGVLRTLYKDATCTENGLRGMHVTECDTGGGAEGTGPFQTNGEGKSSGGGRDGVVRNLEGVVGTGQWC